MRGKGCKRTPTTLFSIFAALVAAFVFSGPAALAAVDPGTSTPAISSDQADYAPGSLVTLSGSNWAPGETVHVDVNDDQGKTWERGVYVTADATGAITDQFNLPDWFVATYAVNATGPISGTATATFTDGNVKYDIAPSGQTTQFVETLYEAANCAPPIKNGYPNTANGSSGGSVGVGSSQSLRLDAAPSSVGGGAFQAWSGPAATFTVIAGTSGRSICVAGFQNGNRNYVATYASPAPKQDQTITFNQPATPAAYNSTFPVSATATSGLTVSIAASGVCTLSSGTVTMTSGTGTCTLAASQGGSAQYNAAPDAIRTVAASKLNQVIAFTSTAPSNAVVGDSYQPQATGGASGNAVTFGAIGACSWNGGTGLVTMTSVGTCTVMADQAGNANYDAAPQVMQSFGAAKANQTIAVNTPAPANAAPTPRSQSPQRLLRGFPSRTAAQAPAPTSEPRSRSRAARAPALCCTTRQATAASTLRRR